MTRDQILKGKTPRDELVRTIVSNLNANTTIKEELTFLLMSDQTSLDEFCIRIAVPLSVADTIKSRFDHPMAEAWPQPDAAQWGLSHATFAVMKGCYRFYRPGVDADGTLGVVQGAIVVRSLIQTQLGIETCCVLTTPKLDEEGQFFRYSGRLVVRGTDSYWLFNQDDSYSRDYIMATTTTKHRNGHDHVGTFITKNQNPSGTSVPIGSEVVIRRCRRADASDEGGLRFLTTGTRFWPEAEFTDEGIRRGIAFSRPATPISSAKVAEIVARIGAAGANVDRMMSAIDGLPGDLRKMLEEVAGDVRGIAAILVKLFSPKD